MVFRNLCVLVLWTKVASALERLRNLSFLSQCRAVMYTYYELKECRPKLKRIKKMLEENMFSGQCCEEDEEHQGKKVNR